MSESSTMKERSQDLQAEANESAEIMQEASSRKRNVYENEKPE